MILSILSLTISLFFGWILILLSIWHSIHDIEVTLYIIFICNALIAVSSIVQNVICQKKILYIKVESRIKSILVNLMLFLILFLSIGELVYGIPVNSGDDGDDALGNSNSNSGSYEGFVTFHRLLVFIWCMAIILMISVHLPRMNDIHISPFARQTLNTGHGLVQLATLDMEESVSGSQSNETEKEKEKVEGELNVATDATIAVIKDVELEIDEEDGNINDCKHGKEDSMVKEKEGEKEKEKEKEEDKAKNWKSDGDKDKDKHNDKELADMAKLKAIARETEKEKDSKENDPEESEKKMKNEGSRKDVEQEKVKESEEGIYKEKYQEDIDDNVKDTDSKKRCQFIGSIDHD